MGIKKIAMLAFAVIVGQSALARENYTLQLNDQETNGAATLRLKQLLQQQHNINPANFQLVGVRLVAKSRQGQGTASLTVGNWQSNAKRVTGSPQDWNRPGAGTFDQIDFNNGSRNDNGAWQIDLQGSIKTRKVVVVLERNGGGGGGGIRYQNIRCESTGNQPERCSISGEIVSARLLQQHSIFPCRANQSFGLDGGDLIVTNGCRGTFEVGYRRN